MHFLRKSGFAALVAATATVGSTAAQDVSDRVGTAEFQYLETLIYARPAGLAGAYTSLAKGEDAIGYNPAGLSRLAAKPSIAATVRYHALEVASGNFTYAFPVAADVRCAVSAAYVNYGRIEGLDEEGAPTGQIHSPSSFNPAFTASAPLSERIRAGATLKGVSEYLGDFEGSRLGLGWGVDAGLQYQPSARNLGFGLSLLNLGGKLRSQREGGDAGGLLPVALKGGFFYHPLSLPSGRLVLDAEVPWHDGPRLAGGLEYSVAPSFQVRVGSRVNWYEFKHYVLGATDQESGGFGGGDALKLAGGFTFQGEGIGIDYATQYWHGLSWVHAVTLRYDLI